MVRWSNINLRDTWENEEELNEWSYHVYPRNLSKIVFSHMEFQAQWLMMTFAPPGCRIKAFEVTRLRTKNHKTLIEIILEDDPDAVSTNQAEDDELTKPHQENEEPSD